MSDIHANLPALHAVLRDAETCGAGDLLCLGDLVGYGTQPGECVRLIRERAKVCLRGNHDEYCSCSADEVGDGFAPRAAEMIDWTRSQMSAEDRAWLGRLPLTAVVDGFQIVHATLDQPQRWGYVFDKLAASSNFAHQKARVCFYGHTHVPVAFVRDSVVRGGTFNQFKVESDRQYFINVGSVGQPRDGDARAAYVLYDTGASSVELRRVDYDRPSGPSGDDGAGKPVGPRRPPPNDLTNAKQFSDN